MTQKEFTEKTGVEVSAEEYAAIEAVYMNSDLDKDEFCKVWRKMNASRVKAAKEAAKKQAELDSLSAAQKAFSFIRKAAAERSEQTGSQYPVTDAEIDIESMFELGDIENFTLYFVLRDTGSTIVFSQSCAEGWANDFRSSNPTIYKLIGSRCLSILKVEEIA